MEEIIDILDNKNLLYDSSIEREILKERINISYEGFLKLYKNIENQYNRCLKYVNFNRENEIENTLYEYMVSFINIERYQEKYNLMKQIDKIIWYNFILENKTY